MFKQASFECSVLAVRVTVFRQSFTSSGIGNSATAVTARLQLLARTAETTVRRPRAAPGS